MLKRIIRRGVDAMQQWLDADDDGGRPIGPDECAVAHPWLNSVYRRAMASDRRHLRPNYTWCLIHAAQLASTLGERRIAALELGVAGGNGLLALERAAKLIEAHFDLTIDVYGFDSGRGLPKPVDHRDLPNLWAPGAYPMDEAALRDKLRRAELIIGLVEETLPRFIASAPAPIAFIAFDLDLYSSTKQALALLDASPGRLLPRVHCYFDDIIGYTYGEHNGERLAIREFNDAHERRQVSPIYGLRHYVPRNQANAAWCEKIFLAHIMDHPKYDQWDGLVRSARMDLAA